MSQIYNYLSSYISNIYRRFFNPKIQTSFNIPNDNYCVTHVQEYCSPFIVATSNEIKTMKRADSISIILKNTLTRRDELIRHNSANSLS